MQPAATDFAIWWTIGAVAACIGGFVVLYLALLRDALRRPRRRRCPKCWYDMSATESRRCPECGREAKKEKHLFKARRNWRGAALGAFLLLIAAACGVTAKAQRDGWGSVTPDTVLLLIAQFSDDPWALGTLNWRIGTHYPDSAEHTFEECLWRWQRRWYGHVVVRCAVASRPILLRECAFESLEFLAKTDYVNQQAILNLLQLSTADADSEVRFFTAYILASNRILAGFSLPLLESLASDADHSVRSAAYDALDQIAPRDGRAIALLIRNSSSLDHGGPSASLENLCNLPPARQCDPNVMSALASVGIESSDEWVRMNILAAAAQLNCRNDLISELFTTSLTDPSNLVRAEALRNLGTIIEDQGIVADAALRAMEDPDSVVMLEARRLFRSLAPQEIRFRAGEIQAALGRLQARYESPDTPWRDDLEYQIRTLEQGLQLVAE